MTTVEIRHRRMPLVLLIIILLVSILIYAYLAFIMDVFKGNTYASAIMAVASAIVLYSIYKVIRKLQDTEPALRFTTSYLEISRKGKMERYLWSQITEWKIEPDDRNHYLLIQAAGNSKRIDITWLDRKPGDISELMHQYKK
jgi:amino acid permease